MAQPTPELRRILLLERVAAFAIFAIVAVVLFIVFGYKPF